MMQERIWFGEVSHLGEYELKVDRQGRVILPVALRKSSGIEIGSSLVARPVGEGQILLETRDAVLRRLRAGATVANDTVEELIAWRRQEAEGQPG